MKIKEIKESVESLKKEQWALEQKFFMAECEYRNGIEVAGRPFKNFYTCKHENHPAMTSLIHPPCSVQYCPL